MLACLLKVWTRWGMLGRGGTCASEEPASGAISTVMWLMRLQCELKALASDQSWENYFEEVLLQKQWDCEPENCPSRQSLL